MRPRNVLFENKEVRRRAAFKFGRRVHFALRRKMLNPPIARLPAIKMEVEKRTAFMKQRSSELQHGPTDFNSRQFKT